MPTPTILVFGSTGAIGGALIKRLMPDHAEQQGLEPVVEAVRGVDRLFLLTSYDVKMLAQSKAVIDASNQADVSHIVHLGAHASPATTIVHLGWHQMIEAYLSSSGLSSTNLHPTSFMQNLLMLRSIGGAPGLGARSGVSRRNSFRRSLLRGPIRCTWLASEPFLSAHAKERCRTWPKPQTR